MPFITEKELKDRLTSSQNILKDEASQSQSVGEVEPQDDAAEQTESLSQDQIQTQTDSQLLVQQHHFRGRTNGTKNIPPILHSIIGISANLSGPSQTAKEFGIAPSTAHGYGQGYIGGTSHTNVKSPELVKSIEKDLDTAKGKAIDAMLTSLGLLDRESMRSSKPRDLASIAKDMASIVEKVGPKKESTESGAKIIILAPSIKQENYYDVVPSV